MDALKRLERAGWHFAPDAERVVYVYEPGACPSYPRESTLAASSACHSFTVPGLAPRPGCG